MIDPTTYAMAWRLGHRDERERRDAERDLGEWTAEIRRSQRWRIRGRRRAPAHPAARAKNEAGGRPSREGVPDPDHKP